MLHFEKMDARDIGGIEPQERDFGLLRGLYESRVMTTLHAATLFFDGRLEAARKRLQKLKAAGLIRERKRLPGELAMLHLASKGFEFLKRNNRLTGYPRITDAEFANRCRVSALTLRHELAVMDAKAALVSTLSQVPTVKIVTFSTWPLMSQFATRQPFSGGYGAETVTVKPDGFLCFRQQTADGINESACFLEVDRGSESLTVLADRAACYRSHYRSGGFAESRGGNREVLESFPFRVLAVFHSAERRNNAAERLLMLNPPIRSLVWLAVHDDLMRDPLGAIWIRPTDYHAAVASTAFEVSRPRELGRYLRQRERDTHVEQAVTKHSLL